MALTSLQRSICSLLIPVRLKNESYVAGGVALNRLLEAPRLSRDIDLFHDTVEALAATISQDKKLLLSSGFSLQFIREAPTFSEAVVSKGMDSTLIQWVHDSAFRFFPLCEHQELGLTLHPFDLATNKILAMAGRLEPRDWIDVIQCNDKLQPLGYLVWAACGKDPGYNPISLLQEMQRSSRYSQAEIDILDFEGTAPDAKELGAQWHALLKEAKSICEILPAEKTGTCVMNRNGKLCSSKSAELSVETLQFHHGSIGGALPVFV
jgi:hypothetical protein